jgi:hypothetical protein
LIYNKKLPPVSLKKIYQRKNKALENCNGCYCAENFDILYFLGKDYEIPIEDCGLMYMNHEGKCPCTNCVIKIMCRNPCEGYLKWSKKTLPDYNKIFSKYYRLEYYRTYLEYELTAISCLLAGEK